MRSKMMDGLRRRMVLAKGQEEELKRKELKVLRWMSRVKKAEMRLVEISRSVDERGLV